MMNTSHENSGRVDAFERNNSLEGLLALLNDSLTSAEVTALKNFENGEDFPVIFVMGPHRSGSTLFMQWLANTGLIAYPTNLLSRFYGAPVIGAQIQLMLTDPRYNFRDEILDLNSAISFESENGKTQGALAPNEFWYFWRRFLPFQELDWLSDEELFRVVDRDKLVSELTSLTRVFGKPFALKSMILNYNIPFLDVIFKNALFVQIKRDPVANVSSILDARKRQMGSESEWYSFKIPEYDQLKKFDPVLQCTGQLHYINKAVTKGIENLTESKKLVVEYESFCRDPCSIFDKLMQKLGCINSNYRYIGPESFSASKNVIKSRREKIEKAISYFDSLGIE